MRSGAPLSFSSRRGSSAKPDLVVDQHEESSEERTNIQEIIDSAYVPFIEDFLRTFNEINTNASDDIKKSAVQTLKQRLQPLVFYLLDKELNQYRKDNHIDLTHLTATQAQQNFLDFSNQLKGDHENLSSALITKNPKLHEICNKTTKAYIESWGMLTERLHRDNDMLKKFFHETNRNKSAVKAINLINVASSDSDPHNNGQQVLILTFSVETDDGKKENRKIIYKPTPVEIDARITGNSTQLQSVLGNEAPKSFFEIINSHNPQHELPTYLIVPRCDPNANNIGGGYGYSEYLPHAPWHNLDINKEARLFFGKFPPSEREQHASEFQDHIDSFFKAALKKGQQNVPRCDYITEQQNDVSRYSYLCGAYSAAMCALGISDMHVENMIISGKKPFLIDLEVALNPSTQGIDDTHAFDNSFGAFLSEETRGPAKWSCMLDIAGELSSEGLAHSKVEKNRYYTHPKGCLFVSKEEPEPCQHNRENLEQGFSEVVGIICANKPEFLQYTHSLNDIPARIVPIATSEMYGTQAGFIAKSFEITSENNTFERIMAQQRFDALRAFSENTDRMPIFIPYSPEYFATQFSCMSIPTFYIRANLQQLHDCHGEVIQQPNEASAYISGGEALSESDIAHINGSIAQCIKDGQLCYPYTQSPVKRVEESIEHMNIDQMLQMFRSSQAAKTIEVTVKNIDNRGCTPSSCVIS